MRRQVQQRDEFSVAKNTDMTIFCEPKLARPIGAEKTDPICREPVFGGESIHMTVLEADDRSLAVGNPEIALLVLRNGTLTFKLRQPVFGRERTYCGAVNA